MRIGINSFLFVSPFTTASVKLFPKFKKWGFATVEIPIEDPSHIDPVKVKAAVTNVHKIEVFTTLQIERGVRGELRRRRPLYRRALTKWFPNG